jgi:hypothetical protein
MLEKQIEELEKRLNSMRANLEVLLEETKKTDCPVCEKIFPRAAIQAHVDQCLH